VASKKRTDLACLTPEQVRSEADHGNPEALDVFRDLFAAHPETCRSLGNVALTARRIRLRRMIGTDAEVSRLAVLETLKGMERELAGENPNPLEALLIERIVTCWLDLYSHELRYAKAMDSAPGEHERWACMLDRAHRRFLAAVKALADVRRLKLPPIQVNIGDKQINTLGIEATGVTQANRLSNRDDDG